MVCFTGLMEYHINFPVRLQTALLKGKVHAACYDQKNILKIIFLIDMPKDFSGSLQYS